MKAIGLALESTPQESFSGDAPPVATSSELSFQAVLAAATPCTPLSEVALPVAPLAAGTLPTMDPGVPEAPLPALPRPAMGTNVNALPFREGAEPTRDVGSTVGGMPRPNVRGPLGFDGGESLERVRPMINLDAGSPAPIDPSPQVRPELGSAQVPAASPAATPPPTVVQDAAAAREIPDGVRAGRERPAVDASPAVARPSNPNAAGKQGDNAAPVAATSSLSAGQVSTGQGPSPSPRLPEPAPLSRKAPLLPRGVPTVRTQPNLGMPPSNVGEKLSVGAKGRTTRSTGDDGPASDDVAPAPAPTEVSEAADVALGANLGPAVMQGPAVPQESAGSPAPAGDSPPRRLDGSSPDVGLSFPRTGKSPPSGATRTGETKPAAPGANDIADAAGNNAAAGKDESAAKDVAQPTYRARPERTANPAGFRTEGTALGASNSEAGDASPIVAPELAKTRLGMPQAAHPANQSPLQDSPFVLPPALKVTWHATGSDPEVPAQRVGADPARAVSDATHSGQVFVASATEPTAPGLREPAAPVPPELSSRAMADVREHLLHAATQAVNHLTLRQRVHADVIVPELGRISVTAEANGRKVDMHVSAADAASTQILKAHAHEITADLRQGNVPLGRMTLDTSSGRSHPDGEPGFHSPREQASGDEVSNPPETPVRSAHQRRVRIVL